MPTIETDIVTAPVYWASALINGDESSFDPPSSNPEDRAAYNRFCAWLEQNGLSIVSLAEDENGEPVEPRFTWHGLLYFSPVPGCEVIDYVAHKVTP